MGVNYYATYQSHQTIHLGLHKNNKMRGMTNRQLKVDKENVLT